MKFINTVEFFWLYAKQPIVFDLFKGVKCPTTDQLVSAKSALDNIVGNLWQQRQESSGSSVGNQVWQNFISST